MCYYVNAYKSSEKIPEYVYMGKVKIISKSPSNLRSLQQVLCNRLNLEEIAACVAPISYQKKYNIDLIYFCDKINKVKSILPESVTVFPPVRISTRDCSCKKILSKAWQNYLRSFLIRNGFCQVGNSVYVSLKDIKQHSNYKSAFYVQTEIINGYLVIWIKLKYRYMKMLSAEDVNVLSSSRLKVRLLPNWTKGILKGFGEWTIKEDPASYWKRKYNIPFVSDKEPVVNVEIGSKGSIKTYVYPISCVFIEYRYGSSLPNFLKMNPNKRISKTEHLIIEVFSKIRFLNKKITFSGPIKPENIGYKCQKVEEVQSVVLKRKRGDELENIRVAWNKIISKLGKNIYPYCGPQDVDYVILYPEKVKIYPFLSDLRIAYEKSNFGKLNPINIKSTMSLENGCYPIDDISIESYENAIYEIQRSIFEGLKISRKDKKIIAFIVIPDSTSDGTIYYDTRRAFFSPLQSEADVIPTQSIEQKTIESYNQNRIKPIINNIIGQIYSKAGNIGVVPWILANPADQQIPGLGDGGVTCYSCFDVSRRMERHTQASIYTALTDPYGRFIFKGNFPSGSEKLDIFNTYTMILSLLRKSVLYSKGVKGLMKYFSFKRLLLAKDGIVYRSDVEIIRSVFVDGIPDAKRKPICELIENDKKMPNNLIVDVIGVNKTPRKEIYWKADSGQWTNVLPGTFIQIDENKGLLVSSKTKQGTCVPIEISLHEHFCFNTQVPKPKITQIAQEYYNLTFLNWNSLYNKSKFALPQLITQLIGENLTYGVQIPENYLCI